MAGVSHLDEIIDDKTKVINMLGTSQKVVGLLLDNPSIDMESDAAYAVFDNNFFDYDYVDDTLLTATALILVDVDVQATSSTMDEANLYIQVVVSKGYMKLESTVFKGVKGNRKDNLTRQIDLVLRDSRDFGIGKLEFVSAITANVPDSLTSKLITYRIPNFGKDRKLGNG